MSDEDDGVEPLNLTLGGSFEDDADAPQLTFENAPTLEDDYGGGATLEDDSAAGFVTYLSPKNFSLSKVDIMLEFPLFDFQF